MAEHPQLICPAAGQNSVVPVGPDAHGEITNGVTVSGPDRTFGFTRSNSETVWSALPDDVRELINGALAQHADLHVPWTLAGKDAASSEALGVGVTSIAYNLHSGGRADGVAGGAQGGVQAGFEVDDLPRINARLPGDTGYAEVHYDIASNDDGKITIIGWFESTGAPDGTGAGEKNAALVITVAPDNLGGGPGTAAVSVVQFTAFEQSAEHDRNTAGFDIRLNLRDDDGDITPVTVTYIAQDDLPLARDDSATLDESSPEDTDGNSAVGGKVLENDNPMPLYEDAGVAIRVTFGSAGAADFDMDAVKALYGPLTMAADGKSFTFVLTEEHHSDGKLGFDLPLGDDSLGGSGPKSDGPVETYKIEIVKLGGAAEGPYPQPGDAHCEALADAGIDADTQIGVDGAMFDADMSHVENLPVRVRAIDDTVTEGNESCKLILSDIREGGTDNGAQIDAITIEQGEAQTTLHDDSGTPADATTIADTARGVLSLINQGGDSVSEGESMSFLLQLTDADGATPLTAAAPLSVTLQLYGTGSNPIAAVADLNLSGWTLQSNGVYTRVVTLADASSTTLTIPTMPDKILEHSESVAVKIVASDLGGLDGKITVAPARYDIFLHYAGGAGPVLASPGVGVMEATQGNDIPVGGGGNTFVWNSGNMGQDIDALDIITGFTKGDSLRFEDLFSARGEEAQSALTALIAGGKWQEHAQGGGGTFSATDRSGAGIHLDIAETTATLTVSYTHEEQQYTQNVELQNFDIGRFHQDNALDGAAVQEMLHEIIKVGGSA